MKEVLIYPISLLLLIAVCFSCKKENIPAALVLQKPKVPTEEYLANLRSYKSRPHQVCFGWFGGYANGNTANTRNRLEAIPDSMDIISYFQGFGNVPAPDNPASATMQNIQKTKGTRFVVGIFSSALDEIRITNFPNLPVLDGIDSMAKSVVDSLNKYHLDGIDVDYEPSFGDGGIFGHGGGGTDAGGDVYTQRLFKAFSNYLGPISKTGKLLIIDGENEPGIASYIDYLAQQAYAASNDDQLQGRYEQYGFNGILPPEKFIVADWTAQTTNNFNGKGILGFYGFAAWNPTQGNKGGAGVYGPTDNFDPVNPFAVEKQMIQIMNPAVK